MKNCLILMLLMAFTVHWTFAQEKSITGNVKDQQGLPLPGVNVVIKGTTIGTLTDIDGNYSIVANVGDILVYSFLGLKEVTKTVGNVTVLNIVMEEDAQAIDEVVVTGYGFTTKEAFTGTATVVDQKNLEAKSVVNISKALAGEVAGVNVINTSGQPGTSATIRIRGFGSVNGNRDPLYVLDGVPFSGSINSINPEDIASTTILKDATATAIYGSRGANGVILITTKSGKKGTSNIEVGVKAGLNFSNLPRYDVIKSPERFIELAWEAMANTGELYGEDRVAYANENLFSGSGISNKYQMWDVANVSELIDPATGKVKQGIARKYNPEDWEDYGFQSSHRTEVDLKMSGGSEKTQYYSSFSYLEDVGYIINSDYTRYSTRLNVTHKPTDWIKANANIGYSYGKITDNGQSSDSGSIFWFVDNLPSIYPLYLRDENGNKIDDPYYDGQHVYDYGTERGFGALTNSIADATYDKSESMRHSLNGNFSFNVDITKDLTFEAKYGAQYYNRISNDINNPFYGSGASNKGSLFKTTRYALTQNFLQLIRYKKNFDLHSIEVLAAHESNSWKRERTSISKSKVVNLENGLDNPTNYVVTSSPAQGYTEETALESYLAQVNYNFDGTYFISGSIRRDGSSRFAKDKWGTFGSIGASWLMSNESFIKELSFIDFLKLKASYGILGDQAGVDIYSGRNTYTIENLNGEISLGVTASKNENLTWETSKIFQTGVEFTLFNNKLDVLLDYYVKNTEDLIFDRRIGPSSGDALLTVNDGVLRNSGLEFDITAHIIKKRDFKLDFSVNGEFLTSELKKMPIDPSTGKQKILDIAGLYGRSKDHSLYDFYVAEWAGVDPSDGAATWTQYYVDSNNNGEVDANEGIRSLTEFKAMNPGAEIVKTTTKTYADATQKYIGKSAIPTVRGAFRINAHYKNFDFSTQFGYSLGGYSYDGAYASLMHNRQVGNNNWHKDIEKRWRKPGDITDVPAIYSNENTTVNSTSSRFITSSDYLTLSSARLGYTFPENMIKGISRLNVWVSGDNLFMLSKRDGFNPATSETGASSTYRYSPLTTVTFGLGVKF
eukprot:TRINITY_DN138_c1_g2_i1.p1 TRINITY_DN138_c1_g2~~TRINITY_DN138_c1_g2_i1.p1  ORF type:complete len:1067 (-),score=215.79 TRINITY_DN138_c1_g2_i1:11351-14551(-)